MSRNRIVLLVVGGVLVVAAGGFGIHQLQSRHREHVRAAALKTYVSKIGPPARALYASWSTYQASIGSAQGSNEGAVRQAHDEALRLRDLLAAAHPPPDARLFHQEMSDVVTNVLTVIEDRLRIAITRAEPPQASAGPMIDPRAQLTQIQREAGVAFYFVKQTFPDAIAQLRVLEAARR